MYFQATGWHRRVMAALVGTCLVVAFPLGFHVTFGSSGKAMKAQAPSRSGQAFALTGNAHTGRGEVVEFAWRTGMITKRLTEPYRWESPDLLAAGGQRLYMAAGRVTPDGTRVDEVLSILNPANLATLSSARVPHRTRYNVAGPSTIVLAPGGAKLFVYSYRYVAPERYDFWLEAFDPVTLRALGQTVPLPGCGGARFATVAGQVVALCAGSNDVRFIDPVSDRVVASTPLFSVRPYYPEGQVAGLAVSQGRRVIYVITNVLRIMAISAQSHRVLQTVTNWRELPQTVPIGGVALTSDGHYLIVGLMGRPRDTAAPFSLRVFALPSLQFVKSMTQPHYTDFVAAPGGGLYMYAGPEANARGWQAHTVSSDFVSSGGAVRFDGPVLRVVLPGYGD